MDPQSRHLMQVGRVVRGAATLERCTRALLRAFIGPPFDKVIAGGQSWRIVVPMCRDIIEQVLVTDDLAPDRTAALTTADAALKRVERLMRERSNIVHGHWYSIAHDADERPAPSVSIRQGFRGKEHVQRWPAAELDRLTVELQTATDEIGLGMVAYLRHVGRVT